MISDTVASHGHHKIWKLENPYPEQKLPPDGLSIVMPTYNKLSRLKRALSSICGQKPCGLPVEILVINDGSTDGTSEFFGPHSPVQTPDWLTVRYFETGVPEWTSPANSYNTGFRNAKYNYMVHSGADIIWYKPTMLGTVMKACDIDRYLIFDYYVLHEPHPDTSQAELLGLSEKKRATLYPWCVVTSAEALRRIGFYEGNYRAGAGEDDAMIEKFNTIGIKFCRVTNQCVINQEHPKEYVRDLKWKANTNFNVRLGHQSAAGLRAKITRGELEKF